MERQKSVTEKLFGISADSGDAVVESFKDASRREQMIRDLSNLVHKHIKFRNHKFVGAVMLAIAAKLAVMAQRFFWFREPHGPVDLLVRTIVEYTPRMLLLLAAFTMLAAVVHWHIAVLHRNEKRLLQLCDYLKQERP
jgi:hypothetical protein